MGDETTGRVAVVHKMSLSWVTLDGVTLVSGGRRAMDDVGRRLALVLGEAPGQPTRAELVAALRALVDAASDPLNTRAQQAACAVLRRDEAARG
jgi:hypothetical protein